MGTGQTISAEYTTSYRGVGEPKVKGNVIGIERSKLSSYFGEKYFGVFDSGHQLHIEFDEITGNFQGWLFESKR